MTKSNAVSVTWCVTPLDSLFTIVQFWTFFVPLPFENLTKINPKTSKLQAYKVE